MLQCVCLHSCERHQWSKFNCYARLSGKVKSKPGEVIVSETAGIHGLSLFFEKGEPPSSGWRETEKAEEQNDCKIPAGEREQVPQGLFGPWMGKIIFGCRPQRLGNDIRKRDNLACRRRADRHLKGHVLEPPEDQFGKPAIFYFLSGPKQFKVLVPHAMVVSVECFHSALR